MPRETRAMSMNDRARVLVWRWYWLEVCEVMEQAVLDTLVRRVASALAAERRRASRPRSTP